MFEQLRPAVVLFVVLSVLTGLIYPFAIAGVTQLAFPAQANGSLVTRDGKVIGSSLIGQNFADAKYFWPRPSATSGPDPADASKTTSVPYNANASTGSNLGPTTKALMDRIGEDVKRYQGSGKVPTELVTASASGLDPHISPAAALYQVPRVAGARKLPEDKVRALVLAHVEGRDLGFLGEPVINVLRLNLALDDAQNDGRAKP
jgi:K+-transporting ATPase ATPase C chain